MILLVLGSFIVVLTTTSTALTDALRSFVSPLRVLHVPADDIAMVFSMAIRFIPLMLKRSARSMMPNSREAPRFIAVAYGNVCLHGSCVHPVVRGHVPKLISSRSHGRPLLWCQRRATYLVAGLSHDTRFGCRIGCRFRRSCGNSGTSLAIASDYRRVFGRGERRRHRRSLAIALCSDAYHRPTRSLT